MSDLEDRKGEPVRLLGHSAKKHKDAVGFWRDMTKAPTRDFIYIIVEYPTDTGSYLQSFRAKRSNVAAREEPPTTFLEAAFQQVPQLEERLISFAKMVAKCRINRDDALMSKIAAVIDRETQQLLNKGATAEYRLINTSGLPNVVAADDE
jgi:hypothetical protein